jgi:hypothetical protein
VSAAKRSLQQRNNQRQLAQDADAAVIARYFPALAEAKLVANLLALWVVLANDVKASPKS